MNSSPYATGRTSRHLDVETFEPHLVSASMSQMSAVLLTTPSPRLVLAHENDEKIGN